jgi:hypothetical protein
VFAVGAVEVTDLRERSLDDVVAAAERRQALADLL